MTWVGSNQKPHEQRNDSKRFRILDPKKTRIKKIPKVEFIESNSISNFEVVCLMRDLTENLGFKNLIMLLHLNHSLLCNWINLIFILFIKHWYRVDQYKACGFQQYIIRSRHKQEYENQLCTYRCRGMTRSWTSFRWSIRAKVLWVPCFRKKKEKKDV